MSTRRRVARRSIYNRHRTGQRRSSSPPPGRWSLAAPMAHSGENDRPTTTAAQLSVVIPFFNEAENVGLVLGELRDVLTGLGVPVEVIAINDGSTDATGAELNAVARSWPELHAVHFAQNCGQAAALWHGFHHARGERIAMLDGDGQNPPAELARLWALRDSADRKSVV